MIETPDCAKIQKLIQYIEGLNRQKKKHDGYRDAVIKRMEGDTLPVEQQAKLDRDWPECIKRNWNKRVQPLIDSIKRYIEDVWPEIIANGSGKWSVFAFKDMLDAGLDNYKECEKSGYIDEPIKELKIVLEKLKHPGSGDETEPKIPPVKEPPKTESWQEVSLDVIDNETVRFKVGKDKWQRINYAELGFKDRRKGLPTKLWPILIELAKHCKDKVIEYHTDKNISKDIDRICETLKKFFGPKDRPILYNKRDKNWKVTFGLTYKIQDNEISS